MWTYIVGSRVDQFNMFSEYRLCVDNVGGCGSLMDLIFFFYFIVRI